MPLYNFNPVSGGTGGGGGAVVDAAGWEIVPGQLPRKIVKENLPDGSFRFKLVVLDGTDEREVAGANYSS
jgi:hypothetical protein